MVNVLDGDLTEQSDVDAIVNAWNRNLFPATRFTISGVSKAILREAGSAPFRELRRYGILPVGAAVVTSAGRLPHRAIIHVAAITHRHRASLESVAVSVRSALRVAEERGFVSLAFPILGAGNGRLDPEQALAAMLAEFDAATDGPTCRIVGYRR